jgi:hypothetical protein
MKKLVIIIILGAIGYGAYLYKFNPDALAKLKNQAKSLLAGSDWRNLEDYCEDFKKENFENSEENTGFVSGLNDEMTKLSYQDSTGATLLLGHIDQKPQTLVLKFKENVDSGIAGYAAKAWKHFFEKETDFSGDGSKSSKHADGYWSVKGGTVTVEIFRNGIEKLPEVTSLPEDIQNAIAALKLVIVDKIKMEKEWAVLDEERHHCFDSARFKVITEKMKELKDKSLKLTEKYKEEKKGVPFAQLVFLQNELDADSL